MPICPWNHLILFAFGAGACVLTASLAGTVAYNGKFGDDNKFLKYTYGQNERINLMALLNVCLALFCVAFLFMSIAFAILQCTKALQIVSWVLMFLLFIATIISQVFSLQFTKYGDGDQIYQVIDLTDTDEFKKYLTNIGETESVNDMLNKGYLNMTEDGPANVKFNETSIRDLAFSDFYVPYYNEKDDRTDRVPSCYLTGEAFVGSFPGIDPCNFAIAENSLKCIGGWNSENFKNYWCYEYRHRIEEEKDLAGKTDDEIAEYRAKEIRYTLSVDSFSAFYEINAVFLGLNCAGLFVLIISLILNQIVQPFNTKTDAYDKLNGDDSNDAKKSEKPKEEEHRIKTIHSSSESEDED